MTIEEMKKELKSFFDNDGKIFQMPTKTKKEVMVTAIVADKLDPNKIYAEKEINEFILQQIAFDDYCTIRRNLIDFGFMTREGDRAQYRLTTKTPDLADYGIIMNK